MGFYKRVFALAAFVFLSACNTLQVGALYETQWGDPNKGRDIFLTIDGTSNRQVSRTNAGRLFEMVDAHHNRSNRTLATYYAEGVGANFNPIGLAAGLGMSDDIKNAYSFLTATYRPGDRIFLSGFSRGAYAVRALGGMVAVAGIPDLSNTSPKDRKAIVTAVFRAYKTNQRSHESRKQHFDRRVRRVRAVFAAKGIPEPDMEHRTMIEALAIWDTVEALGAPDRTEDPTEDVGYYLLTNCNVKAVFHALALDENRSYSFTPIFADTPHVYEPCGRENAPTRIEEVWFAGAHSDVGGSYAPGDMLHGFLPGVSLNWMISKLKRYDILPARAKTFADPLGPIHDAKAGSAVWKGVTRKFRDPLDYHRRARSIGLPKIHATAIARLSVAKWLDDRFPQCQRNPGTSGLKPVLICTDDLYDFGLMAELRDKNCVTNSEDGLGWSLIPGQKCVEVVGSFSGKWPKGMSDNKR